MRLGLYSGFRLGRPQHQGSKLLRVCMAEDDDCSKSGPFPLGLTESVFHDELLLFSNAIPYTLVLVLDRAKQYVYVNANEQDPFATEQVPDRAVLSPMF